LTLLLAALQVLLSCSVDEILRRVPVLFIVAASDSRLNQTEAGARSKISQTEQLNLSTCRAASSTSRVSIRELPSRPLPKQATIRPEQVPGQGETAGSDIGGASAVALEPEAAAQPPTQPRTKTEKIGRSTPTSFRS